MFQVMGELLRGGSVSITSETSVLLSELSWQEWKEREEVSLSKVVGELKLLGGVTSFLTGVLNGVLKTNGVEGLGDRMDSLTTLYSTGETALVFLMAGSGSMLASLEMTLMSLLEFDLVGVGLELRSFFSFISKGLGSRSGRLS